jgi:hypothetical protein
LILKARMTFVHHVGRQYTPPSHRTPVGCHEAVVTVPGCRIKRCGGTQRCWDAGERSDDLGERGGEFTVQGGGHSWKRALRTAGVEPTRANGMHALRHYYASVLLDDGVSIRALAEYLGHADSGFTLRTYTHLMPTSEDRARQAVDAAFSREPDVSQDAH